MAYLLLNNMSWSWNDPSPDEAQEAYDYYRSKYNNAVSEKRASERRESDYVSQRNSSINQMNALSSQKLNFEERLEGIEKIISMMEGTGGWFSVDVPEVISDAQKTLTKTEDSYQSCIRLSGGSAAASLETAFHVKTVTEDAHSSNALQSFINEKKRLEQRLDELKTQINNLAGQIDALTRNINSCNADQAALQSAINSYAYDMNHYKKNTY